MQHKDGVQTDNSQLGQKYNVHVVIRFSCAPNTLKPNKGLTKPHCGYNKDMQHGL